MTLPVAAIEVADARPGATLLSRASALPAFTGTVSASGEKALGFPAGSAVALAGEASQPRRWHVDRAVGIPGPDPDLAARVVLTAHLLYLLRRASVIPGERAHIMADGPGARLLETVAARYGLVPATAAEAELLIWAGLPLRVPPAPGCRALWLAGESPIGLSVVSGPPGIGDLRTHYPTSASRWPMGRCLSLAREQALEDATR